MERKMKKGSRGRHEGPWRVTKNVRVLRAARNAVFFAPMAS